MSKCCHKVVIVKETTKLKYKHTVQSHFYDCKVQLLSLLSYYISLKYIFLFVFLSCSSATAADAAGMCNVEKLKVHITTDIYYLWNYILVVFIINGII